ncbi:MAG: c-type cytochrome, partial [Caldilineaceae bacterium]|nr:c-type cytochrome [Caldilineaceae bacterium]
MMKQLKNFAPRYGRLRYLLYLIILVVPVLLVGCRDERRALLPTPDLDVLVPTPTPPVVRIEVVVMVVTPSPANTAASATGEDGAPSATATAQPSPTTAATQESQGGAPQTAQVSEEELISSGEEVYRSNCATCHQNNGEGSGAYPALNQNGVLTAGDPTQPIQIVLHGRGEMPSFEDELSNRQIAAVLSYERNSWENSASVVTVDQVRQVRQG